MNKFLDNIPTAKSSSKRKHKASNVAPSKSVKTNHTQMYLDFGQKSFNRQVECSKCFMRYIESDKEDQIKHKQYCITYSSGIFLPTSLKKSLDYSIVKEGLKINSDSPFDIISISSTKLNSSAFVTIIDKILSEVEGSREYTLTGDVTCYMICKLQTRLIIGCVFIETVRLSYKT